MEKQKKYTTKTPPTKKAAVPKKKPHFPWSDFIKITVTPEDIEAALWRAGVTKKEHLNTKPNEVTGALMSAYGVDLGSLRRALKQKQED